jgi:phage tail-like protein
MAVTRKDPVLGYNFQITLMDSSSQLAAVTISVGVMPQGGFSECSGLEMSLQVEEHREGGRNGAVLKFPSRVNWSNIRLRRGAALSDELWNWHYGFVEGRGKRRDGVIVLQNSERTPVKVWRFSRGLPIKWTGPTMNANQSQVAIEELEIAHEGLKLVSSGVAAAAQAVGELFGLG